MQDELEVAERHGEAYCDRHDPEAIDARRAAELATLDARHTAKAGKRGCAARLAALRAWARSRIAQCRADEARFDSRSTVIVEAYTERRTLQEVLRVIDGEDVARD